MRRRAGVGAAVAAALALALGGAARGAGDARPHGFDHVVHDGKVDVTGAPPIACATCHELDRKGALRGAPGHAACFGACHGEAPAVRRRAGRLAATAVPGARARVCSACHAPAALAALAAGEARAMPVAYPPYTIEPDFGLALSHARHAAVTACATCHDGDGRPAGGGGHARCAGCHLAPAAGAPAMTACAACHAAAYGPARGPELVAGPLAVGPGFSHRAHARAGAAPCAACHAAVAAADGIDLPAPRTEDCAAAGCHDGRGAFSTTTSCTRCHTAAPTVSYRLVMPDPATARYSHERHRARLPDAACGGCHRLDARGEATAAGHGACDDAACHRADFASTEPGICAACHVAIEPWRALAVEALPRPETEFGAAMPHARHAALGLACEGCHARPTEARDLRPPRGHAACTGDACHAGPAAGAGGRAAAGPAVTPALDACDRCHRLGLVATRLRERLAAPWSVRARFEHGRHGEVACDRCHADAWSTDALPPSPTKSTCAPCHDGKAAFKMTGHGCARCHGR